MKELYFVLNATGPHATWGALPWLNKVHKIDTAKKECDTFLKNIKKQKKHVPWANSQSLLSGENNLVVVLRLKMLDHNPGF